jgi:putative ABC transport system substrate-binding protein
VLEEPITYIHRKRIAELAVAQRLPTIWGTGWADAGGLIAYGTSLQDGFRLMAEYVDKILQGAKPGDLPVQRLTQLHLIVNLKTAREIGVTVPPEVLKQAERVIE